ncbi:MAG: hypothetical protein OEX19_17045, partial [Gammaproteobacteria bacterium]|nr:hypothetical protein [Gammaproteobacteria bacterium]
CFFGVYVSKHPEADCRSVLIELVIYTDFRRWNVCAGAASAANFSVLLCVFMWQRRSYKVLHVDLD